ncbi:MAG TPA: site-2 protease family protein [Kofleriaceae bacterium]|jgi:Zn-dependent protease|nr:site-2 protease family protein [Kofleriaceae bacterium]
MPRSNHDPEPRPRWAWRLGRVAGISIYLHATFLLLLVWIAVSYLGAGRGVGTAAFGLLLVASVFATIVVHELGHALVARRFGITTRDIMLYPIGGMARLERMPERPQQELLVAVVGPLINGVIALAIYLGLRWSGTGTGGDPLTIGASFAVQLMWINLSLGAFNLLPAFPMDGGRILRAILAFWIDRSRATVVAARVGRGLAVVMAIAGLFWNPLLVLIAVFVWLAAGQEAAMEQLKTTLRGVPVSDAMVAGFDTLPADAPLELAAHRIASGFQHDFPVIDDGHIVGMLSRSDVRRGLAAVAPGTPVAEVMHRRFPTADAAEDLDAVLGRLPPDGSAVLVTDHDRPVGLLDPQHVEELLAMRRLHPHRLA